MTEESAVLTDFGGVRLLDIRASSVRAWDFSGAAHVRVELPSDPRAEVEMLSNGFVFADRTLGVSIDLASCPVDLQKSVRMDVAPSNSFGGEIAAIAKRSFPYDRRFNITPVPRADIAGKIIDAWVSALESPLVCTFKGAAAGFLALKSVSPKSMFVHLAAVDEKYRLTGAAMSLYAKAALVARESGCRSLEGRISSMNCAVMNLYAHFGAKFFEPRDVFLKEILK